MYCNMYDTGKFCPCLPLVADFPTQIFFPAFLCFVAIVGLFVFDLSDPWHFQSLQVASQGWARLS